MKILTSQWCILFCANTIKAIGSDAHKQRERLGELPCRDKDTCTRILLLVCVHVMCDWCLEVSLESNAKADAGIFPAAA